MHSLPKYAVPEVSFLKCYVEIKIFSSGDPTANSLGSDVRWNRQQWGGKACIFVSPWDQV